MEKQVKKIVWYLFLTLIMVVLIGGVILFKGNITTNFGSVAVSNEYNSLTQSATTSSYYLFKKGAGTLGSIIITSAGAGSLLFYDATTTNANLRTNQTATSSLRIIASVWESQAAGTYTYDTTFNYGLLGVFSGTQATSTITYR